MNIYEHKQQTKEDSRPHPKREQHITQRSNASLVDRVRAIQKINTWMESQKGRIDTLDSQSQKQESHGVLQVVETTWRLYQADGYLRDLPDIPAFTLRNEGFGVSLPTELASNIRYFIRNTEQLTGSISLHGEGSTSKIDWNTRLGIPEYRTQSDNLVAPEASCNVTTLAMVLERLGIGRAQVEAAVNKEMGLTVFTNPVQSQSWLTNTLDYLNQSMGEGPSYRRVRGQSSMDSETRTGMAESYRDNAQMEDLLDLLAHQIGISRTSVISNPDRILNSITGDNDTPTTEQIWNSDWAQLSEKIASCLENGGAAALSFQHKGSRSSSTHIVSILNVEDDGLIVDDPYGMVRSDYNPDGWDDAYWSKNDNGDLIGSRGNSSQRNEIGNTQEWGIGWAREFSDNERLGQESKISKEQVEHSMFYVQLFHSTKTPVQVPKRGPRIN